MENWFATEKRERRMRLIRIVSRGFRNLDCSASLPAPVALVVGANNTGKSNLIDAIRLLLQPHAGPRHRRWINPDDFAHDGQGNRVADSFELEAVFGGLNDSEQARMVTCLAPSLGAGFARLRMQARLAASSRISVTWYGGDSMQEDVEAWAREAATYTYLHPLRDAAADLRPGRENRLIDLLTVLAPEGGADRDEVVQAAEQANKSLGGTAVIKKAKEEVQRRITEMMGSLFGQKSDLALADPRFERIAGSLRALVGDLAPLEMAENGLGFNNLLYMATLLAAMRNEENEGLHLLLVEEPEAHIHPQLQDLLMRHLEHEAIEQTQVIVTTHSPNLASAVGVERMVVMTRSPRADNIVARTPKDFGLKDNSLRHLGRFLDVTKSSLLFANGVILVEGVAEQLLLPAFARQLGKPLHEKGITVVNVGGLSFAPFIELFGDEKLPYRCAVISDGDRPEGLDDEEGDSSISATAKKLQKQKSSVVQVFLSQRTFEWDLAFAGNWLLLLAALKLLKPKAAATLAVQLATSDNTMQADAFLKTVERVKGPFAQALAQLLAQGGRLELPKYLEDAISWATGEAIGGSRR